MFSVRVSKPSMTVRQVEVSDGETVGTAVQKAGFEISSGEIVTVNGTNANSDTLLNEASHGGAVIVVAPGAKAA